MAVHFQKGTADAVAVVFSCPGRYEELAGHPAARTTGKHLAILLGLLAQELGRNDLSRESITVTNAWPRVEYSARTGRSEATEAEILAPENIARLDAELAGVTDFVIFFGARARAAAHPLRLPRAPRFAFAPHLSARGLLFIKSDRDGRPIPPADRSGGETGANTRKRLDAVARSIASQLAGHPP